MTSITSSLKDKNCRIILIRRVEEKLFGLFSQGKTHGTIHTCIGQEFPAIAFTRYLIEGDFIFSNHRCHGHYISHTNNYQGLIAELMGKEAGLCAGVGSSQHICSDNFFSNGIQGGIVPVAAGVSVSISHSDKFVVAVSLKMLI